MSEEWTAIARKAWEAAGRGRPHRAASSPRPLETIWPRCPRTPPIDLAFVDADKGGYLDYYEALLPRLRPAGCSSSTTCCGAAGSSTPTMTDDDTEAIRRFNDHVAADERVRTVLLTLGDGVTVVQKLG